MDTVQNNRPISHKRTRKMRNRLDRIGAEGKAELRKILDDRTIRTREMLEGRRAETEMMIDEFGAETRKMLDESRAKSLARLNRQRKKILESYKGKSV